MKLQITHDRHSFRWGGGFVLYVVSMYDVYFLVCHNTLTISRDSYDSYSTNHATNAKGPVFLVIHMSPT